MATTQQVQNETSTSLLAHMTCCVASLPRLLRAVFFVSCRNAAVNYVVMGCAHFFDTPTDQEVTCYLTQAFINSAT